MRKSVGCLLALLGVAALGTANSAEAEDTPNGFYVGGGWGQFDLKLDNFNDVGAAVSSISHSRSDDAWKLFAGYRLSPYFSLEGNYVDFGHPGDHFTGTGSDGNYRVHLTGFAPLAVGTLPLGPVELFGKAGWLFYDSNLRVNFNSPGSQVFESSHSASDFLWGGGVGVTFFQHLNFNLEYNRIKVQNANDSNALWLTGAWRF